MFLDFKNIELQLFSRVNQNQNFGFNSSWTFVFIIFHCSHRAGLECFWRTRDLFLLILCFPRFCSKQLFLKDVLIFVINTRNPEILFLSLRNYSYFYFISLSLSFCVSASFSLSHSSFLSLAFSHAWFLYFSPIFHPFHILHSVSHIHSLTPLFSIHN